MTSRRYPFAAFYETVSGPRLTKSQLAFVALEIMERDFKTTAEMRRKAGKKVLGDEKGSAAQLASRHVDVSPSYIKFAARIRTDAPALAEEIKAGKQTIPKALRLLERPSRASRETQRPPDGGNRRSKSKVSVRLNDLRRALGETQTQFAKRFRVTTSCISLWEQASREPRGSALLVLEAYEAKYADKLRAWEARKVEIWRE